MLADRPITDGIKSKELCDIAVAKTGRFLTTRKIDQFHELMRQRSDHGAASGPSESDFSGNQVLYDQGQRANQET
jgi:hypothetical protein